MEFFKTVLEGVYKIRVHRLVDARGAFAKLFHATTFASFVDDYSVREVYYSISNSTVIRGLHFQIPPYDHHKIIFCLRGRIFDVCVDLRKSSSTYGKHLSFELSDDNATGVFIPKGFAHGLQALVNETSSAA